MQQNDVFKYNITVQFSITDYTRQLQFIKFIQFIKNIKCKNTTVLLSNELLTKNTQNLNQKVNQKQNTLC